MTIGVSDDSSYNKTNFVHISAKIMNTKDNNDNMDASEELSRCFICDDKILGRFYTLATCKTQISQTRVIEKLGELVGERYMVVISEDDVICRNCAILVNMVDRLEMEMLNVRDQILHFLEHKYCLNHGELCDNKPKLYQPPQITKSVKEISIYYDKHVNQTSDSDTLKKKLKQSCTWVQCNNCKYFTSFDSFVAYHKDHVRRLFCDDCKQNELETQQDKPHCSKKTDDS